MNKGTKKIEFFTLGLLIVLAACNNPNNQKIAEKSTFKIGLINPMTGELATYGEAVIKGVALAVEEVNNKNLLKGKKLEVISDDSKGESASAISSVQKMINIDGIKYIIGDISSTVTLSILPLTEKNGVFLFSPGAATPKLANASKLFARNWPSNNEEAGSAAEYVFNNLKYKNVCIVYVNNDWGIGLKEYFSKKFTSLGGLITSSEIYEYENIDFKTIILKVKQLKTDCIYLGGNQKEMGNFMKQLRQARVYLPVISNTSFLQSDCLSTAGNSSEGVIVPTPAYKATDSTANSVFTFYKNFKAKYNYEPSLVEANGYDAIMLIVNAINTNGDSPVKVAEYIRNLKNYDGAGGLLNFNNGDVSLKNEFNKIINGKAEVIK